MQHGLTDGNDRSISQFSMSTNTEQSSLDSDEPQTPIWFTFLGIGLFMAAGIFVLATADDEEAPAVVAEAAAAPEGEAAPEAPAEMPANVPGGAAPPSDAQNPSGAAPDPHAGHGH
jgi:hypothetical protein